MAPISFCAAAAAGDCQARLAGAGLLEFRHGLSRSLPASGARAASRHSSGRSTWSVPDPRPVHRPPAPRLFCSPAPRVGKTTISRILAKAPQLLRTGVTQRRATIVRLPGDRRRPLPDYVEMDAASNRGVDDMRALLDQAGICAGPGPLQGSDDRRSFYAHRARLQRHAEDPRRAARARQVHHRHHRPAKIPVTVLSRCLQFNLKQMPPGIVGHLTPPARGRGGALRAGRACATSPRPPAARCAIRYRCSTRPSPTAPARSKSRPSRTCSAPVGDDHLYAVLDALRANDVQALMGAVDGMEARSLSFESALQALASLLHRIALAQLAPAAIADEFEAARLAPHRRGLRRRVPAAGLPDRHPRPRRAAAGARRGHRFLDDPAAPVRLRRPSRQPSAAAAGWRWNARPAAAGRVQPRRRNVRPVALAPLWSRFAPSGGGCWNAAPVEGRALRPEALRPRQNPPETRACLVAASPPLSTAGAGGCAAAQAGENQRARLRQQRAALGRPAARGPRESMDACRCVAPPEPPPPPRCPRNRHRSLNPSRHRSCAGCCAGRCRSSRRRPCRRRPSRRALPPTTTGTPAGADRPSAASTCSSPSTANWSAPSKAGFAAPANDQRHPAADQPQRPREAPGGLVGPFRLPVRVAIEVGEIATVTPAQRNQAEKLSATPPRSSP